LRGADAGFAGTADENLLLALMVEVDVEDGVAAMVPDFLGDGEVKENHALGGLAGADHGVAKKGLGGEGLELGECGVDVVEVELFYGAGGDLFALRGGEGGSEVLEEEREVEAVVDAEGGEDVESVLGVLVADDDRVGFIDRVGGVDDSAGDGEVGGFVWSELENESENDTENEESQKNRHQQVASDGLGELEVGHWHEHSKAEVFSGRLKQGKLQF
jgi:hypothetical protein